MNSDANTQAPHLLIRCELLGPGFVFKPERYQTQSVISMFMIPLKILAGRGSGSINSSITFEGFINIDVAITNVNDKLLNFFILGS